MSKNILVIDDERKMTVLIENALTDDGFAVTSSNSPEEALGLIDKHSFDIIITDLSMPKVTGIDILEKAKQKGGCEVILMTAYGSVESAVWAMKNGAADYIQKPFPMDELVLLCRRLAEKQKLVGLSELMAGDLKNITSDRFIGKSPAAQKMLDMISKVAPTDTSVLLIGRSGTGKELAARMIHENSSRKDKPFIAVNCAALTETLLDSELFCHERGAFTGADRRREGRFMSADKGTIFLDEIGEMSPIMQAKLLRVIQEREIERVGSNKTIKVDVRIIAATNRDLQKDVSSGKFREDLFYRLNVVTLRAPSLRERLDDIPLLTQHFLNKYAAKNRKTVKAFTPLAMDMLLKYDWPGNVRELENAVERAVILLPGDYITEKELPLNITQSYPREDLLPDNVTLIPENLSLEEIEKNAILATLEATAGNKSETARKLGINRRTLYMKLKKFGVIP